jgi:TonB family protein
MENTAKPIIASTSLSFLLHAMAFAGLLLVYDQAIVPDEGVGRGIKIQLISSLLVSDQQEADKPRKQEVLPESPSESRIRESERGFSEDILTSLDSTQVVIAKKSEDKELIERNRAEQQHDIKQDQLSVFDNESVISVVQSPNASQQQHAILELLHKRISDNKEYPYLARRQRREGVATVAFVLHPDGKIENTHLVTSSRAAALDRAALSAVKNIEPFTVAQEYLEQSEEFQVDIEFELL